MTKPSDVWDFARAEIGGGGVITRPERKREELTLADKVRAAILGYHPDDIDHAMSDIADALEDTGSPAHMRVAAELRGE